MRAYTACILANIAFLEPGQQKVLEAGGVAPLVRMLKGKEDAKVTLHSTAAVQNLTYKNTACCSEVLDHGGEKALKKLLQHKKEDIQQFAAGALANLQLYRRKAEELSPEGGAMPRSSMGRKVAKILRRKGGGGGGGGGQGAPMPNNMGPSYSNGQQIHEAAMVIQAQYRGNAARKHFEQNRMRGGGGGGGGGSKFGGMMRGVGGGPGGGGSKYDAFSIRDVRKELGAMGPGGMQENVNPGQRTYGLPSLSSLGGGGGGPSALMKLGGPGEGSAQTPSEVGAVGPRRRRAGRRPARPWCGRWPRVGALRWCARWFGAATAERFERSGWLCRAAATSCEYETAALEKERDERRGDPSCK